MTPSHPVPAGAVPVTALARALRAHYASALAPWEPWRAGPATPAPLPAQVWAAAATARAGPGGRLLIDARRLAACDVATFAEPTRRWAPIGAHGHLQLLANPNHPSPSRVYLGEDGIRFGRDITRARPAGRILDIGSGTGLGALCATGSADEVLGIDIDPAAVQSAQAATRLAGLTGTCSYVHADFRQNAAAVGRWHCVVANLPGVPVPAGTTYGRAGDGGPDGLDLTRALLQRLPEWWHPDAGRDGPCLIMRLQSYGDTRRPAAVEDLRRLAVQRGLRITVTIDSRMDAATRSAVTANYLTSSGLNHLTDEEALRLADDHTTKLGMQAYYSCTVIAVPGTPGVRTIDRAEPLRLDNHLQTAGPWRTEHGQATLDAFRRSLSALPMGFWELGSHSDLAATERRARDLHDLIAAGATARQACTSIWGDGVTPYQAATIGMAVNHLVNCMIATRMLTSMDASRHRHH